MLFWLLNLIAIHVTYLINIINVNNILLIAFAEHSKVNYFISLSFAFCTQINLKLFDFATIKHTNSLSDSLIYWPTDWWMDGWLNVAALGPPTVISCDESDGRAN